MYDLFRSDKFMMRAPLSTISEFLSLQKAAEVRILREASSPEGCDLHQRNSQVVHVVKEAKGEI